MNLLFIYTEYCCRLKISSAIEYYRSVNVHSSHFVCFHYIYWDAGAAQKYHDTF